MMMMKNNKGFTLIELLVASLIGGIVSIVMSTFFTFAAEQINALIDQNEAEQSLMMASYYLRLVIAQSVKTMIGNPLLAGAPAPLGGPFTGVPDGPVPTSAYPQGVAVGYFNTGMQCADANCVTMTNANCAPAASCWPAGWPAGNPVTPMAIFVREASSTPPGWAPITNYAVTGIFFIPPLGSTSGRLYFAQLPPTGGSFILTDAGLKSQNYFDRIVALGVAFSSTGTPSYTTGAPITLQPSGTVVTPLESVNLFLRARYFKGIAAVKDYSADPNAAAATGAYFTDITSNVNVVLRDNVIGVDTTGSGQNERPENGLYFYQFTTPPLQNF